MNLKESIRTILREEINNQYHKNIKIRISNILSVNSDGQSLKDAIINVKDGLSSYSQEPPLLLKMGNKYEILDGFHRIAQKILNGDKYIVADVIIKEPKITLKESIRRILREEINVKNYILRRYSFEELESILKQKLNNQSRNITTYKDKSFDYFMKAVLEAMTDTIIEELTDGWVEDSPISEDGLYEFLKRIFKDNIRERFQSIQKNNLQESEKPQYQIRRERFQKLVDNILNNMKRTCEIMNSEDDEIISFGACELIDADVKVSVSEVGVVNDRMRVLVVIKYHHWRYIGEDEFVYELSKELRKWIGDNYVEVEDYINTYPTDKRQW